MSAAVSAVATAVPRQRWLQEDVYRVMAREFPSYQRPRVKQVFMNAGIKARHLAVDEADWNPAAGADELHAHFLQHALSLGVEAVSKVLRLAKLDAQQIDALFVATSTGYVCPGLSARLLPRLALRTDLPRSDLVGAGCGGALPALLRATDFVRANPGTRALVLTVEVCSACWFVDDTLETVVGNAICADGAAAVVVSSVPTDPGPRLGRFCSLVEPELLDRVGFEFRAGKERIVLSNDVKKVAGPLVRTATNRILEASGLRVDQIQHWIGHTGGARVLDGIEEALGFENGELEIGRGVLRDYGNMSSPTVLFVLARTIEWRRPRPGDVGLLFALGPGLVAETALLHW